MKSFQHRISITSEGLNYNYYLLFCISFLNFIPRSFSQNGTKNMGKRKVPKNQPPASGANEAGISGGKTEDSKGIFCKLQA